MTFDEWQEARVEAASAAEHDYMLVHMDTGGEPEDRLAFALKAADSIPLPQEREIVEILTTAIADTFRKQMPKTSLPAAVIILSAEVVITALRPYFAAIIERGK